VLQPSPYPETHPRLSKLEHLQDQARYLNREKSFYRTPLTTFFQDGRNSAGISMRANTGSGQECTGLNDGSKNTVAATYLADAWNWGAEIFCGCEVRYVEPNSDGNGYIIHFALHGHGREEFRDDFENQLFWVKAVSQRSCCWVAGLIIFMVGLTMIASLERFLLLRCRFPRNHGNSTPLEEVWYQNVTAAGAKYVRERRFVGLW
jgi:hypothetical protein